MAFGCRDDWGAAALQILFVLQFVAAAASPERQLMLTMGPAVPFLAGLAAFCAFSWIQLTHLLPSSLVDPYMLPGTISPSATLHESTSWTSLLLFGLGLRTVLAWPPARRRCTLTLLTASLVVTLAAVYQLARGNVFIYGFREVYLRKPFGPFYSKGHAAFFLAAASTMGSGLVLDRLSPLKRLDSFVDRVEQSASALVYAVFVIPIAAAVFLTDSQAGMAVTVGGLAAAGISFRHPSARLVAIAAILPLFAIACMFFFGMAGFKFPEVTSAAVTRMSLYRDAVDLLSRSMPWGVGVGAFSAAFPPFQHTFHDSFVRHAHNEWLEFLIEGGLPGGGALLLGVTGSCILMLRGLWGVESSLRRTATAAFILSAVYCLVDFPLRTPACAAIFVFCGVLASSWESGLPPRRKIGIPTTLLGLAAALLCLVLSVREATSAAYIARLAPVASPQRLDLLSAALRWRKDPYANYRAAWTCAQLADKQPAARTIFLRQSLSYLDAALVDSPNDPASLYLYGLTLARLHRFRDSGILMLRGLSYGARAN